MNAQRVFCDVSIGAVVAKSPQRCPGAFMAFTGCQGFHLGNSYYLPYVLFIKKASFLKQYALSLLLAPWGHTPAVIFPNF